ncbi:hypothetical protein QR680_003092 [Steinernema hermaphroditum]|uniref:Nucleoporin NSP1-like C-terminal domain-containing protein n=1 Tax=Steinernema hermaphroditum TaxID=289476 RepID=A0AA39H5C6_9BILA|nr:hypothetical protein QR680_003092 [Steinernema hermaphroditum]
MFDQPKFPSTPVSQPNQSDAGKSRFGLQSTAGGSPFGGNTATTLAQSTTPVMFDQPKFTSTPVSQPNQSDAGKSRFGLQSTAGGSPFGGNTATTLAQSTTPVMFDQPKFPSTPVSQPNQSYAGKSRFGSQSTAGGSLFGGNTATTLAQSTFSFAGAATSATSTPPSRLFGTAQSSVPTFSLTPATPAQSKPQETTSGLFGGKSTGGGNLLGENTVNTAAQLTTPISSLQPVAATQPNQPETAKMTMKELEQMLQMMVCEYEEQERSFMEKVVELNAYDAVLRDSRQRVFELVEQVNGMEKEKDRIKANVEFLEAKEKEMSGQKAVGVSDWNDGSQVEMNSSLMPPTQADNQRRSMMQMQVGLDAQIKQADDDLADILEQM